MITLAEARALDAADPLAPFRKRFTLPPGVVYLDGNSLGALPAVTGPAIADMVDRQWGNRLIRSWNEGWIEAPQRIGSKIASLIGASDDEVIVADSTSVNLFKLIVAALRRDPARTTVVTEAGNFPTDVHIAQGAVACVPGATLKLVAREDLGDAIDERTALLLLTHVHYKTAQCFDMATWTKRAHDHGALALWDLSHSTGAIPVALNTANADLAVGCGYKYLNGGPGAPAYLFVAKRLQDELHNPVSGWMGHAAPFDFSDGYVPASGMSRWLTGTPPMIAMAGLEYGVDSMLAADPIALAQKGAALFDIMASIGDDLDLECVSPRDPAQRGSHISFRHPHAYALCQALIAADVIGDFRDPDIIRFGLTPLYIGYEDIVRAGNILRLILSEGRHLSPRFSKRHAVT